MIVPPTPKLDSCLQQMRTQVQRLCPITDLAWHEMKQLFQIQEFSANEHFIQIGDNAQRIAFIVDGGLREYFVTQEGNEFNKHFVFANDITGSLYDLLSNEPSIAGIVTLKKSTLLCAHYRQITALYDRHPCLQKMGRLQAEALLMRKAKREHDFLTLSATQRYLQLIASPNSIEQLIPQYHIASYLGITPVALSRLKKKLAPLNPG